MRSPAIRLVGSLVLLLLIAGSAAGQIRPTDEAAFAAAKARTEERLKAVNEADIELVLPVNYFVKEYQAYHPVPPQPGEQPGGFLTMADGNQLVAADMVATAMLEVAEQDFATSAQYLNAWTQRVPALKEQLLANANLTPRLVERWMSFLATWQKDVMDTAPDKFPAALRQGAYAVLRQAMGVEEAQVQRVLTDIINARASGGVTTGVAAVSGGHYWRGHDRKMDRIERRHDWRMYKIQR
jgi:hypothetical protein